MASLLAKIVIPFVALTLGVGFFVLRGMGNIDMPQANLEANLIEIVADEEMATTTAVAPVEVPKPKVVKAEESTKEPQRTTSVAAVIPVPDSPFEFNPAWRDAVVNLYCFWGYGHGSVSSGSGVIIDPRGIILTNAHVATDFLYYDTPKPSLVECWVRTGSPSEPKYRAKLLYIPAEFVTDTLTGVGEYTSDENYSYGKNDYALLVITKTANPNATLPASFPYLPLDTAPIPNLGSHTFMVGYAGSFLGQILVMKGLNLLSTSVVVDSIGSIKGSITSDTLVFKGSVVGQHGSSGGAVIRSGGKLTAIPSYFIEEASTTGDSTSAAITIEYINRDLKTDTGFSLQEFIDRDTPQALSETFLKEKAPIYHKQYVDACEKLASQGAYCLIPGGY